jgi:hypothetical protein
MFTNLLGSPAQPEDAPLSERMKSFFGMQKPPSQTQQLAFDIRSTLEMPESASGFFSGMKSSLLRASSGFSAAAGIEEIQPGDASMMREIEEATTLSYRQRFNAFFVCLGLGIVCSGLVSKPSMLLSLQCLNVQRVTFIV